MSTFYGTNGISPGCLYDLTLRGAHNDQLTCFSPSGQQGPVSWVRVAKDGAVELLTDQTGRSLFSVQDDTTIRMADSSLDAGQVTLCGALHLMHAAIHQTLALARVQQHGFGQDLDQQGRAPDVFQPDGARLGQHRFHHPALFAQAQVEVAWMALVGVDRHPLAELAVVLSNQHPLGRRELLR